MLYCINFLEVWLIDEDSLDKKYVGFNDHKNPKYYELQNLCADSSVDPLEQERGELGAGARRGVSLCCLQFITVHDCTMTPAAKRCSSGAGACLLSQAGGLTLHISSGWALLCCHIIVIIIVGRNR